MKQPFFILVALFFVQNLIAQPFATHAFTNGKIYTANDAQPFAEAMAINGENIIYIGNNNSINAFINANTIVENLNGRLVLPGIHDVHQHPLEAGTEGGSGCHLHNDAQSVDELIEELDLCNIQPNTNGWILANGHSIFTLYDGEDPSKYYLDDLYPDDPVAILEETSHSVWVNSKALEIVGIDDNTPDPPGGHIYKNPTTGEVDGILMDNAGDVVLQMALAANNTINNLHYDGLIEFGLPELAKNGITSICEARTYWKRDYQDIWQELRDNDLLTCRVVLNPWIYPDEDDAVQIPILQSLYNTGDNMLKATQVKCYSDGIIPNATAALHEPYIDNNGLPFNTGLNYIDADRLANLITVLEQTGYDFHIHAIGDRGITESLDAIETARNANGNIGARHRITHVEIVKESDYPRFAQLNVTADMQVAGNFTNPENWDENLPFLGADRVDNIIPLKSIFDTGARITLSSDWDVSSLNPFVGMQNALTRAPQNLPTVQDAVKAYTINGAYVLRQENQTGSLEVGKWADFICVNQDIFTIPVNQIAQTEVLSTWVGGTEVYRSDELDAVSNIQKNQIIDLYPTPVKDRLFLDLKDEIIIGLDIFNVQGDLVKSIQETRQDSMQVNVADLSNGVYFLKIALKNGAFLSDRMIKD